MTATLFQAPKKITTGRIKRILQNGFYCTDIESEKINEDYYDTFDLSLYRNGAILCLRGNTFFLFSMESGRDIEKQKLSGSSPPRFWWDFHHEQIRKYLKSNIDIKSLLKLGSLKEERTSFVVQNTECKNVGRGSIHNRSITTPSKDQFQLPSIFAVTPLKGFESEIDIVCRKLQPYFEKASVKSIFISLITESGYKVRLEKLKYPPKIDAHWSACYAIKTAALHLIEEFELYRPGIIDDIDTEFLHNYRVALRRLRAITGQMKYELPGHNAETVLSSLKTISSYTGNLRDLDVLLLHRRYYIERVPRQLRRGLELFFKYIEGERQKSHERTAAYFASKEYTDTVSTVKNIFTLRNDKLCNKNSGPVRPAAAETIEKRFKKLRKKIGQFSHNKEIIHSIRIDCKKVRYLLELFSQLFPGKGMKKMIKELKQFQNRLGNLHDIFVQQEMLLRSVHTMEESVCSSPEATAAVGGLITALSGKEADFLLEAQTALQQYGKRIDTRALQKYLYG